MAFDDIQKRKERDQNPVNNFSKIIQDKVSKNIEEMNKIALMCDEDYSKCVQQGNERRQVIIQEDYPRILNTLKETILFCDGELQKYMSKYASFCEQMNNHELKIIGTDHNDGMKETIMKIDYKKDFIDHIKQNILNSKQVEPKIYTYTRYGKVSSATALNTTAVIIKEPSVSHTKLFGSDLITIMTNDPKKSPVPSIVTNCIQSIESYGLKEEGIYRISGSNLEIEKLKKAFESSIEFID
jgi:hypothetical protein